MEDFEKTFNAEKFGIDVLSYRTVELEMGRKQFSESTGISQHVINHIENSHTVPNINDVHRLATLMGKSIYQYFN